MNLRGVIELSLHLSKLVLVPPLLLLPVCSHLFKHVDSLLLLLNALLLGSAVGLDFSLGSSSLCGRLHQEAACSFSGGYLRGSLEDSRNLRIHIDELVAFDSNFLVSVVDSIINPLLEGLSNDTIDEVAEVLPLESEAFFRSRQSVHHNLMLTRILENVFDSQPLVVRHSNCLDLICFEAGLSPRHDISQVDISNSL